MGHLSTSILGEEEYESNGRQSPTVTQLEWESVSLNETVTSSRKRALSYSEQHDNRSYRSKPRLRSADDQAILFVACESEKCKARGLRTPEDSYYNPDVQKQIQSLTNNRSMEIFRRLLLYVASAQAITLLREAVRSWRTQTNFGSWQISQTLSKAETFNIIQGIDQSIACLSLFRRYYILRLFENCGGCETPSYTRFVLSSGDFGTAGKKAGNPLNNAEAEVTAAMMGEIYPNLQPGTQEHKEKSSVVNFLRLLARRFRTLTTHFGEGILALIPYQDLPGQQDLSISDNM